MIPLVYIYRPQTKFAKIMFLHVSVILSTGGGLQAHINGGVEGYGPGGVSRPIPRGEVGGSGWEVSSLKAHTQGEVGGLAGGSPGTGGGYIPACTCHVMKQESWCLNTHLHVGLFQRRYNGTYTQAHGH